MRYEEAAVRWVLKQGGREDLLDQVDWENPPEVVFDQGEAVAYSEYTYEPAYSYARVVVGDQYVYVDLVDAQTSDIVRQIVEVVNSEH